MTDYLELFIRNLEDKRSEDILRYHKQHLPLMLKAKGSSNNHQNWRGGYYDHILECFNISKNLYNYSFRKFTFSLDEALIVLYFHDIEKMFKYAGYTPLQDKHTYLKKLNILTEDELEAIKYIHGEGEDYSKFKRVMSPLAAFCHCVDVMSARIWYDEPKYSRISNV